MTECVCRPQAPLCLWHFGLLPRAERERLRRKLGLRRK